MKDLYNTYMQTQDDRMSRLMAMQRNTCGQPTMLGLTEGLEHTPKKQTVRSVKEIVDDMDNDTIFRWFHVPFVVVELIWDRLEGAEDVIRVMGLDDRRKTMREIKNIRREINSIKNCAAQGMLGNCQEKSGQELLDDIEDRLENIYKTVVSELKDRFGIGGDLLCMAGAVHEARVLYHAVNSYNGIFRKFLRKEYGLTANNPLPKPYNELDSKLKLLVDGYALDMGSVKMKELVEEMVDLMFDVELREDDGSVVTSNGKLTEFVKNEKK